LKHVLLAIFLVGCGSKKDPGPPVGLSGVSSPIAEFVYDSLDARAVSSDAARGKAAVLVFMTTYDLASQANVNFAIEVSKRDPQSFFAMVALEDRAQRELVESYRDQLNVKFPVAMIDVGHTGFGEVRVPTVIVLDPKGKIAFRKEGIVKGDELRQAIDSAQSAKP
jgi:hypothetical protein